MLCGHTFSEQGNQMVLPEISQEFNMCPLCKSDDLCYLNDNCCPDKGINLHEKYQTECSNLIAYLPNNISYFGDEYKIIHNCPEGTDKNITNKCTKSRNVYETIQHPPVTSNKTSLSFKNNLTCALCNNVSEYISWKDKYFMRLNV